MTESGFDNFSAGIAGATTSATELPLIDECRRRSVELLRANLSPEGILASSRAPRAADRHYTAIFGRDAAICALGMVVSGEKDLIEAARAGLLTLGRYQAANGQIPKYVKPEKAEVDFWYSGCIDATLWWLAALRFFDRHVPGAALREELRPQVGRALDWLACQEHPVWNLVQQNEASDWADIMPRSGFVLYSNVLWYWVKKLYGIDSAPATRDYLNYLFFPYGPVLPEHRRARLLAHYIRNKMKRGDFYLSFVNLSFWGEEIDVFGNLLCGLLGVADSSRAVRIVEALREQKAHRPWPVRVVGRPIERNDPLWRRYMQRHRQNLPFQYHNGGAWPFVGAFWVLLLERLGMSREACEELTRLAEMNRMGGWEFNEWFHGRSGESQGMPGQSWNAAMYLLAHAAVTEKRRFF